jgi:hypothetical protein
MMLAAQPHKAAILRSQLRRQNFHPCVYMQRVKTLSPLAHQALLANSKHHTIKGAQRPEQ